MTESELQSSIKQSLKKLGYQCMSTSTYVKNRRGAVETGLPDLLVSHQTWPEAMWLGLEVKLDKGKLSAEQETLAAAGRIVVVRSWDDAWEAVKDR